MADTEDATEERPALADKADVVKVLGRELTSQEAARVDFVLRKLSNDFRRKARQTFTVEAYAHRRKVDAGQVLLPRGPIATVASVVDDQGSEVPFTVQRSMVRVPLASHAFVTVTYTAGLDHVPTDVRDQIAESAKRVLSVDVEGQGSVDQYTETTGPFSTTRHLAAWAVGGQSMLSPDDITLARSYRPKRRGHTWVGRP